MQPIKVLSYILGIFALIAPIHAAPIEERGAASVLNTVAGALGDVGGGVPAKVLLTIAGGLGGAGKAGTAAAGKAGKAGPVKSAAARTGAKSAAGQGRKSALAA